MLDRRTTFTRYTFGTLLSCGTTFGLLLIMYQAINNEEAVVSVPHIGNVLELVRKIEDKPPEPIVRDVEPPPPVAREPEPVTPTFEKLAFSEVTSEQWKPVRTKIDFGAGRADGDVIPVLTVAPDYPQRELTRGVEGWVLIEFSVDELGRVVNPQIIMSHPGNGFNRAALKAVSRYKYKPRVVNGMAVPVHGVRQKITFNLQA
ncbi:MAG: TonB family protein [Pseudomonadota bacterium]